MRILVIRNEPPWPLHYGGKLHCYELCRRLAVRHELLMVTERPGAEPGPPFNFRVEVAGAGGVAGLGGRARRPPDTGETPVPHFSNTGETPVPHFSNTSKTPAPHWLHTGEMLAEHDGRWGRSRGVVGRVERFFGFDPGFCGQVLRRVREWRPDVVLGMGYLSLPYLARVKGTPTVCDLQDDEALHRWRELWHGRMNRKREDLKCLVAAGVYERAFIPKVGAVTVLSRADERFCRLLTGHPRIACIPHGVDCDYYRPAEAAEEAEQIIFWGGLDFGPNISAILFFAEKVWPLVRRERPGLRWTIVGGGSPAALEPVRRLEGVEFTGFVEDIRPYVARATVAVVPMVSGAGIKNKLMEAWAMGKAVVCTPRALGDLPGEHGQNVWVARSERGLARGLTTLLADQDLRQQMGQAARMTAVERCSWDGAAERLERLCAELAGGEVVGHAFGSENGRHGGRPRPDRCESVLTDGGDSCMHPSDADGEAGRMPAPRSDGMPTPRSDEMPTPRSDETPVLRSGGIPIQSDGMSIPQSRGMPALVEVGHATS